MHDGPRWPVWCAVSVRYFDVRHCQPGVQFTVERSKSPPKAHSGVQHEEFEVNYFEQKHL